MELILFSSRSLLFETALHNLTHFSFMQWALWANLAVAKRRQVA
jgi:hypothetical protein